MITERPETSRAALADRIEGSLGPFNFISKDERAIVVAALRAPPAVEGGAVADDRETLAQRIDQCAAISLVGSDGIKGYLPVGSPKIISAALRALSQPQIEGGAVREALAQVSQTLSFFKSVIHCGEAWSATCQAEFDKAQAALAPPQTGNGK